MRSLAAGTNSGSRVSPRRTAARRPALWNRPSSSAVSSLRFCKRSLFLRKRSPKAARSERGNSTPAAWATRQTCKVRPARSAKSNNRRRCGSSRAAHSSSAWCAVGGSKERQAAVNSAGFTGRFKRSCRAGCLYHHVTKRPIQHCGSARQFTISQACLLAVLRGPARRHCFRIPLMVPGISQI